MSYLAQPREEFSDLSHAAEIHGLLPRQTNGRKSVLMMASGVPYKQAKLAETWDGIVIGSGIGGLTAAVLMGMHPGKRVLVLERHYMAGGFTHTRSLLRCLVRGAEPSNEASRRSSSSGLFEKPVSESMVHLRQ